MTFSRRRFNRFAIALFAAAMVAIWVWGASGGRTEVAHAQGATTPDFRIVDVRAEYGQMIVEVQFFHPDGSHWHFEHFTFQGRELFKNPRVVDAQGFLLLEDGSRAPTRLKRGKEVQYLPPGRSWKRHVTPHLDDGSILGVVQAIYEQRLVTGWTRGAMRLTTTPLDGNFLDYAGAGNLAAQFAPLIDQAYQLTAGGSPRYVGDLAPTTIPLGLEHGTVSTFFPDADAESTSVDGLVIDSSPSQDWTTKRDTVTADTANDSSGALSLEITASTTTDEWTHIGRVFWLFDTSALPDGDVIASATLGFVSISKSDGLSQSLSMVTTTPASSTALATTDFPNIGTTKQAADITVASITSDSSTYNDFTLDSTGLGNISKTAVSKFGARPTSDADDAEPTWSSGAQTFVEMAFAEEVLAGDKRPMLTVTHSTPAAALTGTIGDGAAEQEVRDGAGTIIVTLTAETWVAAGATFDAQRSAIIQGLDAADAQTNGWNAQVRDQLTVARVVRTSDTVATITVPENEAGNYFIATDETITMTVPAAAVTGAIPLTATPTITITAGLESAAMTGTLGGSGGVPSEIVAGGETVILTLTNTKWAVTADFNAQRQAILDGLTSSGSGQNGWNSLAFAVGDVIRTSDTVVTITLTAEAAYAILTTETISTVIPGAAMVYSVAVTTPETFAITASFKTSGTRVSAAINLSGVTNVAYCAIGWEAVTPTNTTVAVATSVDGGTNYSSAANGSCPTGITVGGSLATITDFRIRVTLTTTDTTVTPLITALGMIIEDDNGQELYYQLNSTPSATLTDRSGSGNTGTMSFPVQPSSVTSSSAAITSTSSELPSVRTLASQDVAGAVTGSATSPNLFPANTDSTGFAGLPLNDLVNEIATVGDGLPIRFVWYIFLGIAIIGAGMLALHLTHGNLFISAGAMAAVMGFQMAIGSTGLLPGWILFVFIPLVGAFLLFRKGFPA